MPAHADDDRSVQGSVRLAVPATVEPVSTVGPARASRDRTGAAELGQGGLPRQTRVVVSHHGQVAVSVAGHDYHHTARRMLIRPALFLASLAFRRFTDL